MEPRRIVIALLIALALSGAATFFLWKRLGPGAARQPEAKKVVAAKELLQAGVELKMENLTVIDWPISVPLEGSFSKVEDVVGRSLIYPMGEKEPVLERDLATRGAGIGLTVKIPEGMRATSIRSNEIVGVAGFLFPGSHVDVLGTFHPPGKAEPITQTVLQNVEVLTAGQRIQPDPNGKPETVNVVTLLLNSEDSEKLILASSLGSIQFVLRNGADKVKADIRPVSLEALLGTQKPAEPVVGKRTRTRAKVVAQPAPRPPEFYSVEVIQGDKRSVEKFQ